MTCSRPGNGPRAVCEPHAPAKVQRNRAREAPAARTVCLAGCRPHAIPYRFALIRDAESKKDTQAVENKRPLTKVKTASESGNKEGLGQKRLSPRAPDRGR